jgi:hypothetical protein
LRCAQIKEKGALLRVYLHSSGPIPDEVRAAVGEAVAESKRTCEGCTAPGQPRRFKWQRTLCENCAQFSEEFERRRLGGTPANEEWLEPFRGEFGQILNFEDALRRWRSDAEGRR